MSDNKISYIYGMVHARDILKTHNLRYTVNREGILTMFLSQNKALSQPELEKSLEEICDRVTIYRTLATFLDKGVLHKVLDDAGVAKYALCASDCDSDAYHSHDHVHFKCLKCEDTICINDVHIPSFHLPKGYVLQEVNVLLTGVCAICSK